MTNEELITEAKEARKRAYVPYSHYSVGAALLTKDGRVYCGCNMENAAYSPSLCAERTAFARAVYEGEREFSKIAIVGGPDDSDGAEPCTPCGVCRQVMMEFCDPASFMIVLSDGKGGTEEFSLQDLMPLGFGPVNLR